MKKFFLLILALSSLSKVAFAGDFFLKTFATVEYSAPSISGAGDNRNFKTNVFEKQIKNFENIAVGFNFRVHQNLGFNLNWQQTDLNNNSLQDAAISSKARFKLEHTNLSALFYTPKISDIMEFFFEAGISDMRSILRYNDANGNLVRGKSHQTVGLFGAGMQITPFTKSKDVIRFSVQRYTSNMGLINSDYTTVRLGYMKAF